MDAFGLEQLAAWLAHHVSLIPGPLFCVIRGATRGRRWAAAAACHEAVTCGNSSVTANQSTTFERGGEHAWTRRVARRTGRRDACHGASSRSAKRSACDY
jgi:hypothetical protein